MIIIIIFPHYGKPYILPSLLQSCLHTENKPMKGLSNLCQLDESQFSVLQDYFLLKSVKYFQSKIMCLWQYTAIFIPNCYVMREEEDIMFTFHMKRKVYSVLIHYPTNFTDMSDNRIYIYIFRCSSIYQSSINLFSRFQQSHLFYTMIEQKGSDPLYLLSFPHIFLMNVCPIAL